MNHYTWDVRAVQAGMSTLDVAQEMADQLNALETGGFEVYDVREAPIRDGFEGGLLLIGRKPQRFPVPPKR